MRPLWQNLVKRVEEDGRVALITLAAIRGSTPREAGARMIISRDGAILGTVGGGALEYRLISEARAALADEHWLTRPCDLPLGPDLGQCCGGHVTYLIETFSIADLAHLRELAVREAEGAVFTEGRIGEGTHLKRAWLDRATSWPLVETDADHIRESFLDDRFQILLFGAGHIGRALTLALAPLPFHIRWIDSRDHAFPTLMPQNVTAIYSPDIEAEIAAAPANAFLLVMTHSHPLDLAIVTAALRRDDLPFVGLIGSATKKARFIRRFHEVGLGDAARKRLVSPIGLPTISGKEPAVIAASIAADLLIRRDAVLAAMPSSPKAVSRFSSLDVEGRPYE